MTSSRVQIIGGGPAGLYVANLLKQGHPDWEVQVGERLPPSDTYGFGVGLSARTLRNLQLADAASQEAVVRAGYRPSSATMQTFHDVETWRWGAHNAALTIARASLLEVLQASAARAGVHVETGREWTLDECDADLVIAADGSGSSTRHQLATEFGATTETGRMLYIWVGLDRPLPGNLFVPVRTEHGVFVIHAYPYSDQRSTLVVETDEDTWRAAGLDATTTYDSPDDSDDETLSYLQAALAPHLMGGALIGNRSRWLRYTTVRCQRWFAGRTVLLGDAARTAHYSLGSGTKLALEDAIQLSEVLIDLEDPHRRLGEYEQRRRPAADRLQRLAHRSHLWWEGFPARAQQPAALVTVAYFSRGGNVPVSKVQESHPETAVKALEQYAGVADVQVPDAGAIAPWVIGQPFEAPRVKSRTRLLLNGLDGIPPGLTSDDVVDLTDVGSDEPGACDAFILGHLDVPRHDWMGEAGNELVASCRRMVEAGSDGIVLHGSPDREAVLDRLSLGERIRMETSSVVAVEAPVSRLSDLVDGLVGGRTDLLLLTDTEVDG